MEEIFYDLFNIVQRVKQINNKYRVFRNKKKKRFELYYQNGLNLEFELVLPYEKLDYRTIDLVLKSRVENADKIFKEIDEFNCGGNYETKRNY